MTLQAWSRGLLDAEQDWNRDLWNTGDQAVRDQRDRKRLLLDKIKDAYLETAKPLEPCQKNARACSLSPQCPCPASHALSLSLAPCSPIFLSLYTRNTIAATSFRVAPRQTHSSTGVPSSALDPPQMSPCSSSSAFPGLCSRPRGALTRFVYGLP